jgi:drug/metabolite transporter (DMT)-like permease
VILAAVVWAGYALLQKQLLLRLWSPAMLLFIYVVASAVLVVVGSALASLLGQRPGR